MPNKPSKIKTGSQVDVATLLSAFLLIIAFIMPRFMAFKATRISVSQGLSAKALFGKYYIALYLVAACFIFLAFLKKIILC